MRKILFRALLLMLLIALAWGIRYCWVSFPVMTGFAAKNMCSAVFLQGRSPQEVQSHELGVSPLHLVDYDINYKDSTVTARVFGLAAKKAIFRRGLGATLVAGLPEEDIRRQPLARPPVPGIQPAAYPWPQGNGSLPDSLLPPFTADIRKQVATAFADPDPSRRIHTRAVVVIWKGRLLAEQYAPPFGATALHTGWSMTKSVTSAHTGLLVAAGKLKLSDARLMPGWMNAEDGHERILLQHLLQQSSGLDFEEDYSKSSDATRMLTEQAAMGEYAATRSLANEPGKVWYYSSGNTNILSHLIRQKTGDAGYMSFLYDSLLYRIGMYSAILEPDAGGTMVGSSYMYATARDWARFGQFYLQQGNWNGTQILPQGWIKASTTPGLPDNGKHYGFQWWLNAGKDGKGNQREYPSVPADAYYAEGFEGQIICVVPSKELVIVRLGQTAYKNFDFDGFLGGLCRLVP